jgi:hypothetical protein
MMYFIFTLLAAFGIGYVGMSWYIGNFKEYFSSSKTYNVNMCIFLCFCMYMGVWAQTMLIS